HGSLDPRLEVVQHPGWLLHHGRRLLLHRHALCRRHPLALHVRRPQHLDHQPEQPQHRTQVLHEPSRARRRPPASDVSDLPEPGHWLPDHWWLPEHWYLRRLSCL
ncbi:hypothetical protein BG000_002585, partial [Podila horticola]